MKWTVAGVGALLSAAGAYAMISGDSIIQVERGWSTFIAGSVLFGAGMIVLALAAVMGRIDRLAAIYASGMVPGAYEAPEAPQPEAEPATRFEQAPPPPREVVVEPLPTLESLMAKREAAPAYQAQAYQPSTELAREPAREPAPEPEPAPEARPEALRNFEFVFPLAETAPEEPVQPVETPKPAPRAGLTWLRRAKPAPAPAPEPEPEAAEPFDEAVTIVSTEVVEIASVEPASQESAPEDDHIADAVEERAAEDKTTLDVPEAPRAPEPTPDPFSHDWLERALAGVDEPRDSRSRFTPPSVRRAAALEQKLAEDEAKEIEAGEPEAVEQADVVDASAIEPEANATSETAEDAQPAGPTPVEIGRYRANDVAYVMFSDGSITAETPTGNSYRFNSLVELRAFIERGDL